MKTEQRLDKKLWIDKMVNSDALISMLENQSQAIDAVRLVIKDIEKQDVYLFKKMNRQINVFTTLIF